MESPDSEQKKALLTGFDKGTSDMQHLEVQKDANLNDWISEIDRLVREEAVQGELGGSMYNLEEEEEEVMGMTADDDVVEV